MELKADHRSACHIDIDHTGPGQAGSIGAVLGQAGPDQASSRAAVSGQAGSDHTGTDHVNSEHIGVYIHIPFCKSKCRYCDFNSYAGKEHLIDHYFNALIDEIKKRSEGLKGRQVKTIFIGGGTPSLMEAHYITNMLEVCSRHMELESGAEISMESNPGSLTYEKLRAYKAAGINRLSMGLQAWQDRLLKDLGRIHTRRQFEENFEVALAAGFQNINVDLIFGLPGQTFDDWMETLEAIATLRGANINSKEAGGGGITHISCYDLQIEEGTVFGDMLAAGEISIMDDELNRRMYSYAVDFLGRQGLRHYEISNFAKPGFESRHNLIYWKAREYAGFGAGAHSFLDRSRFSNETGIEDYISGLAQTHRNRPPVFSVSAGEAMGEFMMLGFRLVDGVSAGEFKERFGEEMQEVYGGKLDMLMKRGLIKAQQQDNTPSGQAAHLNKAGDIRFMLTRRGLDLANKVFVEFIDT